MVAGAQTSRSLPISVRDVVKRYGAVRVLDDVSIDIKAGEFMTLLGPSGSGKTTLLMALAGFVSPESGSIRFGDTEVIKTSPHKRGIGMVFQSYALFPFMSVLENVAYPLKIRGVSAADQKRRADAALEMVKLGGYADRRINQLSGGQKQRVALARAMVFEPRIILMDEPLSALDKKLREHMQIELKALHQKLDATVVYVTHDQREALTMSDRIAVIDKGRIVQLDRPQDLYRRPKSLFVADFIGESVLLPVERDRDRVMLQGRPLKFVGPTPAAGKLKLVIRPELLRLGQAGEDDNVLRGAVRQAIYQGESVLLIVDAGNGQEISVRIPMSRAAQAAMPEVGREVDIALHRDDTVVLAEGAA
ncbi:MAG: ABC transporter ATP-binding protein [Gammaproteobacteria bacterium]|nr:ABC transporter ATP-binding protein [Gammaproteobacteria bacterium]